MRWALPLAFHRLPRAGRDHRDESRLPQGRPMPC
jgi:hypothetical protein